MVEDSLAIGLPSNVFHKHVAHMGFGFLISWFSESLLLRMFFFYVNAFIFYIE